jgi:hypothetical protein
VNVSADGANFEGKVASLAPLCVGKSLSAALFSPANMAWKQVYGAQVYGAQVYGA